MRRWLARLSWSFLILGLALGYDAWRAHTGRGQPLPEWRIWLQYVAALVFIVLFMAGVKARHHPDAGPPPPDDRR